MLTPAFRRTKTEAETPRHLNETPDVCGVRFTDTCWYPFLKPPQGTTVCVQRRTHCRHPVTATTLPMCALDPHRDKTGDPCH